MLIKKIFSVLSSFSLHLSSDAERNKQQIFLLRHTSRPSAVKVKTEYKKRQFHTASQRTLTSDFPWKNVKPTSCPTVAAFVAFYRSSCCRRCPSSPTSLSFSCHRQCWASSRPTSSDDGDDDSSCCCCWMASLCCPWSSTADCCWWSSSSPTTTWFCSWYCYCYCCYSNYWCCRACEWRSCSSCYCWRTHRQHSNFH